MSDWSMLIWLTQLGLSVVLPLAGMTGLAIWLCGKYQLGRWVVLIGILLGFVLAVSGFKNTLKQMEYMEKRRERFPFSKKKKTVTGGAYGNPKDCFARNGNHCNR